MKEKFINWGVNFITKYQECDDLRLKKIKYGLEGMYNLIVKLSVVITIAFITKTYKETLLLIVFYAGLRTFSFGLHAKTNIGCWITTISVYNIFPLLIKNIIIPKYIGYIVIGIAFISFLLWAPADTPKRPLIRKNLRKKDKLLCLIIISVYTLIYIISKWEIVNNSIIYALLIQSICINPITYKICNTRFNNYKYYHKKELKKV